MPSPPRPREADGAALHAAVLIGTKPAGQAEGQLVGAHKGGAVGRYVLDRKSL
jgi:hypothetical protein